MKWLSTTVNFRLKSPIKYIDCLELINFEKAYIALHNLDQLFA